ncbi:MAG: DUF3493 domain-containing protein [Synechococcales cyanobacterium RM1_1_8]|nr:DUF3493 domain-containing protein [Synechococcales cyanobacterium RM1_1_8]
MPARQPSQPSPQPKKPPALSPEKYARLKAEAKAPFRGLRRFLYLGFAASGAMGGFIFLTQALAGRDVSQALPNLAVQLGVVGLMVGLLRLDRAKDTD